MGYAVNQYNKSDTDNSFFMTALENGVPVRVKEKVDISSIGAQTINPFENEGIYMENKLEASKNYYFHGKIKQKADVQIFYVYLVEKDNTSTEANEQYLKTITVPSGDKWTDVEFIFTPMMGFDTILFRLQRTVMDYTPSTCRYPVIIYQELSVINNLLKEKLDLDMLYKIGVQSRPGFLMCINGEEIRIGRSGIYELRNGFVFITFFSAVSAAKDPSNLQDLMNRLPEGSSSKIDSQCIFNTATNRDIDNFSLDYVYKE